jgi:hypothetical protein
VADLPDLLADQHHARSPEDKDVVGVLVALQGGVPAGTDLEVAELGGQVVLPMVEDLSSHAAKGVPVLLVGEDGNALPGVVALESLDHPEG